MSAPHSFGSRNASITCYIKKNKEFSGLPNSQWRSNSSISPTKSPPPQKKNHYILVTQTILVCLILFLVQKKKKIKEFPLHLDLQLYRYLEMFAMGG